MKFHHCCFLPWKKSLWPTPGKIHYCPPPPRNKSFRRPWTLVATVIVRLPTTASINNWKPLAGCFLVFVCVGALTVTWRSVVFYTTFHNLSLVLTWELLGLSVSSRWGVAVSATSADRSSCWSARRWNCIPLITFHCCERQIQLKGGCAPKYGAVLHFRKTFKSDCLLAETVFHVLFQLPRRPPPPHPTNHIRVKPPRETTQTQLVRRAQCFPIFFRLAAPYRRQI